VPPLVSKDRAGANLFFLGERSDLASALRLKPANSGERSSSATLSLMASRV